MKRKLVTLGVLLAVLAGGSLLVALVGAGGESGDAQAIVVEQFTTPDGVVEVLVTVSQELNVPATAGGAKNVVSGAWTARTRWFCALSSRGLV